MSHRITPQQITSCLIEIPHSRLPHVSQKYPKAYITPCPIELPHSRLPHIPQNYPTVYYLISHRITPQQITSYPIELPPQQITSYPIEIHLSIQTHEFVNQRSHILSSIDQYHQLQVVQWCFYDALYSPILALPSLRLPAVVGKIIIKQLYTSLEHSIYSKYTYNSFIITHYC